jgi:hypothetical protein
MSEVAKSATRRQAIKISRWARAAAGFLGLAGVGAGGTAVFVTDVEAGPVALIGVGAIFLLIALAGTMPTRLKIGDNEAEWQEINEAIEAVANAAVGKESSQNDLDEALANLASVAPGATTSSAVQDLADRVKRYGEAAQQLGHERPAIRLAGVYALAALADDWPERRQTCIDVLCAYLRMPFDTNDPEQVRLEGPVRKAVLDQIQNHVSADQSGGVSWSSNRIDLSGAAFKDTRFEGCQFDQAVLFSGAMFDSDCAFVSCFFKGGADLSNATVAGRLRLSDLSVGSGVIRLDSMRVEGILHINVDHDDLYGRLSMNRMSIDGKMFVQVEPATDLPAALVIRSVLIDGLVRIEVRTPGELPTTASRDRLITLRDWKFDGRLEIDERLQDQVDVINLNGSGRIEFARFDQE